MIDVPEGHHDLSHHGSDAKKLEKIKKINTFHMEQFAYLLGKLKAVKEPNGTTPARQRDDASTAAASATATATTTTTCRSCSPARAAARSQSGRHIMFPKRADTPLMNLFLALFERMGAPAKPFGDSTGVLKL